MLCGCVPQPQPEQQPEQRRIMATRYSSTTSHASPSDDGREVGRRPSWAQASETGDVGGMTTSVEHNWFTGENELQSSKTLQSKVRG